MSAMVKRLNQSIKMSSSTRTKYYLYHGGEFFECLEESVFEKYESCDLLHLDTVNKNRTVIDCTKGIFGRFSAQSSTKERTGVSPTEIAVVRVLEANLSPSDVALSLLVG
jgi:hypothetical protein